MWRAFTALTLVWFQMRVYCLYFALMKPVNWLALPHQCFIAERYSLWLKVLWISAYAAATSRRRALHR